MLLLPPPVCFSTTYLASSTTTDSSQAIQTTASVSDQALNVPGQVISKMDVLKAVQTYVNKMITEVTGMKVLLLDAHTVSLSAYFQ